jgi:hypothetical protein
MDCGLGWGGVMDRDPAWTTRRHALPALDARLFPATRARRNATGRKRGVSGFSPGATKGSRAVGFGRRRG